MSEVEFKAEQSKAKQTAVGTGLSLNAAETGHSQPAEASKNLINIIWSG
jgi:hypothetical protein